MEPRAGAPASSWIRMYFYSYDVTPIQRQMPVTGRDPDLLRNWDAILQITVDPVGAVSAMDLAHLNARLEDLERTLGGR